jgi:multiple sugar transport system substrate-binding protein
MTKRYVLAVTAAGSLLASAAQAETLTILMEAVPDTTFVQQLVPEFEAETGIDVEIEVVNYAEMFTKLVPQLTARSGSYSLMVVDFYWVGQFAKAGWMQPLDERIAAAGFDTSPYIPQLMNLVGQVDGVTLMLPFYNYAMGLTYRTDLLADPAHQAAFEAATGMALRPPQTWDEYLKQVDYFTQGDLKGVVNQGLRPDPIVMEWSNYLFANGGTYNDADWQPTLQTPAAVAALEQYSRGVNEFGPLGSASFGFDEAFNVMAQGGAYSYITYNFFRTAYDDPSKSAVVGKVEIMPVPGPTPDTSGGLNGAWGWAIPKSSPNPDVAWRFLQWVESPEIAKRRAMAGGAPTRVDVFEDPDLVAKYPYYPALQRMLATSHNFPTFTYTPQLVEELGRELSLAVAGQKTPAAALADAEAAFADLLRRDGKLP